MGAETAAIAAAGITAGSAIFGASQSRKAGRRAARESIEQTQILKESREKVAKEQDTLSKRVAQEQKRVAAGQARANRSRLRGGVFGESEPTPRGLSPTLG